MPLSAKNRPKVGESEQTTLHRLHESMIQALQEVKDAFLQKFMTTRDQHWRLLSGSWSEDVKICSAEALKAAQRMSRSAQVDGSSGHYGLPYVSLNATQGFHLCLSLKL